MVADIQDTDPQTVLQEAVNLLDAGMYTMGMQQLHKAMVLSGEKGDTKTQADCYYQIGKVKIDKGHPEAAKNYFETALSLYRQMGNADLVGVMEKEISKIS